MKSPKLCKSRLHTTKHKKSPNIYEIKKQNLAAKDNARKIVSFFKGKGK
jgi:hypothetical protein